MELRLRKKYNNLRQVLYIFSLQEDCTIEEMWTHRQFKKEKKNGKRKGKKHLKKLE